MNRTEKLCSIFNNSFADFPAEDENLIKNLCLILIPLSISLIVPAVVYGLATCGCKRNRSPVGCRAIAVACHDFTALCAWVILACFKELNDRSGFFMSPRNPMAAEIVCKGVQGFLSTTLQMSAVLMVMRIAWRKRIGLIDTDEDSGTWKSMLVTGCMWIGAAAFGACAAVLHESGCLIFLDSVDEVDYEDSMVSTCDVGAHGRRLLFHYGRLTLMVVLPMCFLFIRVCSSCVTLKLNEKIPRIQSDVVRPPQHEDMPRLARFEYEEVHLDTNGRRRQMGASRRRRSGNPYEKEKKRRIRFLLLTTLIYVLCWAPIHVLHLIQVVKLSAVILIPSANLSPMDEHQHETFMHSSIHGHEPNGTSTMLDSSSNSRMLASSSSSVVNFNETSLRRFADVHGPHHGTIDEDDETDRILWISDMLEQYLFALWILHPALMVLVLWVFGKRRV